MDATFVLAIGSFLLAVELLLTNATGSFFAYNGKARLLAGVEGARESMRERERYRERAEEIKKKTLYIYI